jgi:phosphoribulokinase
MSVKHPIIAVTGSSGAGTTTVMKSFTHIFRREKINAQIVEGDAFHRYDRNGMREALKQSERDGVRNFSHFGPRPTCSRNSRNCSRLRDTGAGKLRHYVHDDAEAATLQAGRRHLHAVGGRHQPRTDLMFYEGLHGAAVTGTVDVARHADLLVGVVPIINLEWIQKLHRDQTMRGYSHEAVVDTILRRMPDYVNYICPQFSRTHVNFQRVPTVDTSNPFTAREIPQRTRASW